MNIRIQICKKTFGRKLKIDYHLHAVINWKYFGALSTS